MVDAVGGILPIRPSASRYVGMFSRHLGPGNRKDVFHGFTGAKDRTRLFRAVREDRGTVGIPKPCQLVLGGGSGRRNQGFGNFVGFFSRFGGIADVEEKRVVREIAKFQEERLGPNDGKGRTREGDFFSGFADVQSDDIGFARL